MARHRSPRGQRPQRSQRVQPQPAPVATRVGHRRRGTHRLPAPVLPGAVAAAVVATGAVVVSLGSADAELAANANNFAVGDRTPLEVSTVSPQRDPEAGVAALAKGFALAEQQAQLASEETEDPDPSSESGTPPPAAASTAAAPTGGSCSTEGFNGVADHVAQAGHHLQEKFGVEDVGGVAARPGNSDSDHPRGYALDFMVDESTGDALAAYAEENSEALGVKYILWQVANHYDHVHISFNDEPGSGLPC